MYFSILRAYVGTLLTLQTYGQNERISRNKRVDDEVEEITTRNKKGFSATGTGLKYFQSRNNSPRSTHGSVKLRGKWQ